MCSYSLEVPGHDASNDYTQFTFSWRNKKQIPGSHMDLFRVLDKHLTLFMGMLDSPLSGLQYFCQ